MNENQYSVEIIDGETKVVARCPKTGKKALGKNFTEADKELDRVKNTSK